VFCAQIEDRVKRLSLVLFFCCVVVVAVLSSAAQCIISACGKCVCRALSEISTDLLATWQLVNFATSAASVQWL